MAREDTWVIWDQGVTWLVPPHDGQFVLGSFDLGSALLVITITEATSIVNGGPLLSFLVGGANEL